MLTYRKLKEVLSAMTDEELEMTVTVSEGCDENGNAEFFGATQLLRAFGDGLDAASDGVLESPQHVILFET